MSAFSGLSIFKKSNIPVINSKTDDERMIVFEQDEFDSKNSREGDKNTNSKSPQHAKSSRNYGQFHHYSFGAQVNKKNYSAQKNLI